MTWPSDGGQSPEWRSGAPPGRRVRRGRSGPGRQQWWQAVVVLAGMLGFVAVVAAVSLVLTSEHHWTKATRDTFVDTCTSNSGGRRSACQCIVNQLEKQISEQKLIAEESRLQDGGSFSDPTLNQIGVDAVFCGVKLS